MRRPVGVILSCIVLGFVAFVLLMMAALMAFLPAILSHIPTPVQPGQSPADMGQMRILYIFFGLFFAALAIWAAATIVGLVRMKNWARYSIMIIGGGLVFIGLIGILGLLVSQRLIAAAPMPPGQNPAMLHFGLVIGGLQNLVIAGIGIWWLVYFAKRRTREAFASPANLHAALPVGYVPPPSPYAASTYEVASYVTPVEPPVVYSPHALNVGVITPAPPTRPLTISILGWLFIAGAVLMLPYTFLPFPLFLFGVILSGWAAHLTMLCLALISALVGIGLLRLEKVALYAACVFQLFGILNSGLMILPSYRDRMIAYTNTVTQKMLGGMPTSAVFDNHTMGLMMLPGIFMGVVICTAVLVLLIMNRRAFDRA